MRLHYNVQLSFFAMSFLKGVILFSKGTILLSIHVQFEDWVPSMGLFHQFDIFNSKLATIFH
jgi:hypothetical protein